MRFGADQGDLSHARSLQQYFHCTYDGSCNENPSKAAVTREAGTVTDAMHAACAGRRHRARAA